LLKTAVQKTIYRQHQSTLVMVLQELQYTTTRR
jgi:hypothetical protein